MSGVVPGTDNPRGADLPTQKEIHMKFPRKRRVVAPVIAVTAALLFVSSCNHKSDTVSKNLSTDADSFKVFRQIVVYNGLTDKYILEVDGWCALGNDDGDSETTYTCKVPGGYVKDIIKKSDNTFVFVHQLTPHNVSDTYFKVILRPENIIPDLNFQ